MTVVIFETERLIGRHVALADDQAMHAVYGNPLAMRHVGDGQPLSLADCQHWLTVIFQKYQRWGYGMSALVRKADGLVVGFCGLVHPQDQPEAEVKYALRQECWGQGLATEAVSAMLAYGQRALGIGHIIATVAPAHLASQHVLEKAGMQRGPLRPNPDGSFTQLYTLGQPPSPAGPLP
jgi:[ribosomal protein S5]-alanine N-acetyltransferase